MFEFHPAEMNPVTSMNPWTGPEARQGSGGVSARSSSLQAYHLVLHRGPLHPEFFQIEGRRRMRHGEYEFEAWIFGGGHCVRFEHRDLCVTETVASDVGHLPEKGHIITFPCAGEKDHEELIEDRLTYITSIQTETLSPHLFASTYKELLEHGRQPECLMKAWRMDTEPQNLSVLDMQRLQDEVHIQCYHMRSDCGLVLRTQSIFQVGTDD